MSNRDAPTHSTEGRQLATVLLVAVLLACVAIVVEVSLRYRRELRERLDQLVAIARSQAHLIEAISTFDAQYSRSEIPGGSKAATLSQVESALASFVGFGKTGELMLGERRGDTISFLVSERSRKQGTIPESVPWEGSLAEPMRRALSGESGSVLARDYLGEVVLAAHEPLPQLGWGLVAKIDHAEFRAPFVQAAVISILIAVLAISLSLFLLLRITQPLIRRVERSEARMRGILDTAVDAVISIDEKGRIELANAACEELFGYPIHELIGLNVNVLMPAPYRNEHDEYIENYLRTNQPRIIGIGREAVGRRKDGTVFPIDLSVSEVTVGKRRTFTGVIRDLSEHKRLTEKLVERESLAKLGELSTIVAHEVKNPLAGIIGAARMLERRLPAGSDGEEICEELISRAQSLNASVRDILTYARPQAPSLQSVPARILLEDVVSMVSTDPQFQHIEIDVDGPEIQLSCDVEMMKPVILNILMNASQALAGRGRISIRFDEELDGVESKSCRIVIADDGPGISQEALERVFEPFFTTRGGGTGLGLPIAKKIVELHGGGISIDCPDSGGTRVSLVLPSAEPDRAPGSHGTRIA